MLQPILTLALSMAAPPAPPVTALAYSPDGKLLAAGAGPSVALIAADGGKVTGEWPGLPGRVTALAYAPNGTLAVACGEVGKSGVVRLTPGSDPAAKPTAEWAAHKDAIYGLAFSPDGQTLATAGYDRVIHLWNVPAPGSAPRLTLKDHSDTIYFLAFSPDGKLLASVAADRTVKLWNPTTGQRLYSLSDATDWLYALAWLGNDRIAAGGVDKSVRTWEVDVRGGKLLRSAFAHEKGVARLLAAGDKLISVGEDRVVKVWDAKTLTEARTFAARADTVQSAALRPGGKQLALGLHNGTLELLNPMTGDRIAAPLPVPPKPPAVGKLVPNAVPRGQTARLTLEGTGLAAATAADSPAAGVRVKLLPEVGANGSRTVEVTASADAAIGAAMVTLRSPAGASNAVTLWVDRFALADALPRTVAGTLPRAGAIDTFRFDLRAGEALGAQVISALDGAKFEPILTVSDESGAVVAEGARGRLGFVAPAAGPYTVAVRDGEFRGGSEYAYRLHLGPVPVVTGVAPAGVARGTTTPVRVTGVHLPEALNRAFPVAPPADAKPGSRMPVPIPRAGGDPIGAAEVTVGEFPSVLVGANGSAVLPAVPGTADGTLARPGKSHSVRFPARKGQRLILEVEAARLGSPIDSFLELRDAGGKPVPSATLRCAAKTYVTLRDHDSAKTGIRLETWNELAQDDYILIGEELLRIAALPRNPDDDCQFYSVEGKRRAFLGTTTQHHPFAASVFKVELHPPGATFPPNGMPVQTLFARNDDGGAGFGKDSKIVFDPPADGEYVAVVRDNGGATGPYRLTARPPRPDFSVRLTPITPNVPTPGGVPITVTATRTDEFEGPITVRFEGLPSGWSAPATVIEREQLTAEVPLSPGPNPPPKGAKFRVVATGTIGGKEVVRTATSGALTVDTTPDLVATTHSPEVVIAPGGEAKIRVQLDRRNFKGRVPLDVKGLPHGVRVLNVGLNGILVLPNQTEREIVIGAEPWVAEMERPIVVFATQDNRDKKKGLSTQFAAPAVTLRVQRAVQAAAR